MTSGFSLRTLIFVLMGALLPPASVHALDPADVPLTKQTKPGLYLDARQAYALKQRLGAQALFVDIRTRGEVSYVGMPDLVDAHIPILEHPDNAPWDDKNNRFKMELNTGFEAEMLRRLSERGLTKNDTIILICRSGDRSARAANVLFEAAYKNIYTVVDGFEGDMQKEGPDAGRRSVNGWKNSGLPWSYQLDKNKMALPLR